MYAENVSRGIMLLDEHKPGWRDLINLNTLFMWSGKRCILGQIFGKYDKGLDWLDRTLGYTGVDGDICSLDEIFYYGFSLTFNVVDRIDRFDDLTIEWKNQITGE